MPKVARDGTSVTRKVRRAAPWRPRGRKYDPSDPQIIQHEVDQARRNKRGNDRRYNDIRRRHDRNRQINRKPDIELPKATQIRYDQLVAFINQYDEKRPETWGDWEWFPRHMRQQGNSTGSQASSSNVSNTTSNQPQVSGLQQIPPITHYDPQEIDYFNMPTTMGPLENGFDPLMDSLLGGPIMDAQMPDAQMPDTQMLEAQMPEAQMPEKQIPERQIPEELMKEGLSGEQLFELVINMKI